MARNGALNYLRHRRVIARNESALAYNAESAEREAGRYEQTLQRLTTLAGELPAQQRRVVELCFVKAMDYKEIAHAMGISVNTVKTHLQRAMKILRDGMREDLFLLFLLRGALASRGAKCQ
jgi:RNA polymerase sigma-70 factor (ECF subfamily)